MLDLVGNPKDRLSHDEAHTYYIFRLRIQYDGLLKEEQEQNEFIEQFVLQK